MADSILDSTKKILGLAADYTPFDLDIITHINAAFSTLDQLGIGPEGGYYITDNVPTWDELDIPANQKNMVRSWLFLKVRMAFDPPGTSYLIAAMEKQIDQFEWRLNTFRENIITEAALAAAVSGDEEV